MVITRGNVAQLHDLYRVQQQPQTKTEEEVLVSKSVMQTSK